MLLTSAGDRNSSRQLTADTERGRRGRAVTLTRPGQYFHLNENQIAEVSVSPATVSWPPQQWANNRLLSHGVITGEARSNYHAQTLCVSLGYY